MSIDEGRTPCRRRAGYWQEEGAILHREEGRILYRGKQGLKEGGGDDTVLEKTLLFSSAGNCLRV